MTWRTFVLILAVLFSCISVSVQKTNLFGELEKTYGIPLRLLDEVFPPAIDLPQPDVYIRQRGYPAEKHVIETEDGYLLGYYRIPHGRGRNSSTSKPYPVILVHGYMMTSYDWITSNTNESLAYILADDGYDVWMGNLRGTIYSRGHVSLSTSEGAFWNFGLDEMGFYDVPAAIDYILNITKAEKAVYIGHSLGNTVFYIMAATRPEHSRKILFEASLAPFAGIPHTTSSFRLMIPVTEPLKSMPPKGPLTHNIFILFLFKLLCDTNELITIPVCVKIIQGSLFGYDSAEFSKKTTSIFASTFSAGFSIKSIIHTVQLISLGILAHYDYGPVENVKIYNNVKPPAYNLSSVSVPIIFYQGRNDILADTLDSQLLYEKIPLPMGFIFIDFDNWNHIDFVYARDLRKYVNEQLLQFIRNVTSNPKSIDIIVQNASKNRSQTTTTVDKPFNYTNFITQYSKLPNYK